MAALATIADIEDTTVMDLLREAAREIVCQRAALPQHAESVRTVVWQTATAEAAPVAPFGIHPGTEDGFAAGLEI